MNKIILALINLLLEAILSSSTEPERVKHVKLEIGKVLGYLGAKPDGDLTRGVMKLVDHLVAANPPSHEDVKSASTIGEIVVPAPAENKAENVPLDKGGGTQQAPATGGEGGANAPPP